ncbi:FmdB family zinc ribbon protein [Stieleria bergensis]
MVRANRRSRLVAIGNPLPAPPVSEEVTMPLYEYECNDCEQSVEVLVRRPDEKVECPTCHSEKMIRLMSAPAAPNMKSGGSLPVASAGDGGACGAPRCCGGGCDTGF